MNGVAEFLLARIAEDEALARGRVQAEEWHGIDAWGEETADYIFTANGPCAPSRVLAECEAKRRIVALHRLGGNYTPGSEDAEGFDYCATCGSGEPYEYPTIWPCDTLRLLALPHASHPDYREEWTP